MLFHFLLPKYESETLYTLPFKLAKLIVLHAIIYICIQCLRKFISRYWESFLSVVFFYFFLSD